MAGSPFTPRLAYVPAIPPLHLVGILILGLERIATLYALTKSLASVLSLPLTLHPSLSPHLVPQLGKFQKGTGEGKKHKRDNVPPELSLIVTAVLVLKMVYGLDDDGPARQAVDPRDPAFALPDAKEYLAALQTHHEGRFKAPDELFSPTSTLCVSFA